MVQYPIVNTIFSFTLLLASTPDELRLHKFQKLPSNPFHGNPHMTFKRLNSVKRHLVITNVSGSGENGCLHKYPLTPNALFIQEAIGAEYEEGLETFRTDSARPMKVDMDFLNDRLQEGFLQRIRYAMKPDEAYGLIFSLDSVVLDTQSLILNAWKQLAEEEGKSIPEDSDVQNLMLYAGADQYQYKL